MYFMIVDSCYQWTVNDSVANFRKSKSKKRKCKKLTVAGTGERRSRVDMTHEASEKVCLFVALLFLVSVDARIRCTFATVRTYIREEDSVTTGMGYYQRPTKSVRKFAWLYVRG